MWGNFSPHAPYSGRGNQTSKAANSLLAQVKGVQGVRSLLGGWGQGPQTKRNMIR
jgi:hypothetical protein